MSDTDLMRNEDSWEGLPPVFARLTRINMSGNTQTALFVLLLGMNLSIGPALARHFFIGNTKTAEGMKKTDPGRSMQFPRDGEVAGDVACRTNSCSGRRAEPEHLPTVNTESFTEGYKLLVNYTKLSILKAKHESPSSTIVLNGNNQSSLPSFKVNLKNESVASTNGGNEKSDSLVHSHLVDQSIGSVNSDYAGNQKNESNVPLSIINQKNPAVSALNEVIRKSITIASPPQQERKNRSIPFSSSLIHKNEPLPPTAVNENSEYIPQNPIASEKNQLIQYKMQKYDSLLQISILNVPSRRNELDDACPPGMRRALGHCRQVLE